MRSKLYLPSIVHDVKRAVGVAVGQVMPAHTGCNANLAFGGRFDFFIGFDECVAKKNSFLELSNVSTWLTCSYSEYIA